jgi:hypothetical protein
LKKSSGNKLLSENIIIFQAHEPAGLLRDAINNERAFQQFGVENRTDSPHSSAGITDLKL